MTGDTATAFGIVVILMLAVAVLARPRGSTTKLDYYLAGKRVGLLTNACAICGDYFSAASFLGVAAAVYATGLDGVWYATGFAAGFLPVLLFIAAPLRRFGDFSLPDFLGERFRSDGIRITAVVLVQLIVMTYIVPQAIGSGITWDLLVGRGLLGLTPYATGVVLSIVFVAGVVVVGGMRGATWNQAMQFLFLMAILAWLAATVATNGFSYPQAVATASEDVLTRADTAGTMRTVTDLLGGGEARFGMPGARYGVVGQFGLLVTLILGTAGLPHVMNRYFTSPSGRAARMTTVWVLALAGVFYALAVMLGTAARVSVSSGVDTNPWLAPLTLEGVLRIPEHALLVLGRLRAGPVGMAVVAAGALVAILSTISGLLIAAAASWGHDIYERYLHPAASQRETVIAGRAAVVLVAAISMTIALTLEPEGLSASFSSTVAAMVTWAFALAGSSLTPVMILAIWWRGTSPTGALAGLITGGVLAAGLMAVGVVRLASEQALSAAVLTPSMVAAPAAVAATVVVSLLRPIRESTDLVWLRMHGTASDRRVERLARLTLRGVGS